MALSYVLDEHLRWGALWRAIQQHNALGFFPINVDQVGDPVDLPLGSTDPDILLWAEKQDRVVVTRDYDTMLTHLAAHLQTGHHCTGLFLIRPKATIRQIVDYLVIAAYSTDPAALRDCYEYIP